MSQQPAKIAYFYSDSRSDEVLVKQVKTNLDVLERLGHLKLWSMRDNIGSEDKGEILKKSLKEAKIVLFFFSADFLVSRDYSTLRDTIISAEEAEDLGGEPGDTVENWILTRHERKDLQIVPVLLDNFVGFDEFPYSRFTVLPAEKPLRKYGDRADRMEPCFEIGETIRGLIGKVKDTSKPAAVSPLPKMPPIPVSLLPQLCDRTEQNYEMRKIFETKQNLNNENKPLVCIIHGDTDECPEGYKARLEKKDVYKFLRLDFAAPIKKYNLEFPHNRFDIAQPQEFFERNLSEKIFETTETRTIQELSNFISQFRTVIINYEVFSENWNENVINVFMNFWNNAAFQNLPTTMLVNLFFAYDENTGYDAENNIAARFFFNRLKQTDFANYPNINIAVLAELDAVERIEVINWINDEEIFRDFCSRHISGFCDDFLIKQAINDLYGNKETPRRFVREIDIPGQPKKEIPLIRMRTLSEKLSNLLVKNRCR